MESQSTGEFDNLLYCQCAHCHHFYDEDFGHLEDGEQYFDHDAEPGLITKTLAEWKLSNPELFITLADKAIGPNSVFFDRKGKL